jgi:hypothetical protein
MLRGVSKALGNGDEETPATDGFETAFGTEKTVTSGPSGRIDPPPPPPPPLPPEPPEPEPLDPELPDPEVPDPEVPEPDVPVPEVPVPDVPVPEVPVPDVPVPDVPVPDVPVPDVPVPEVPVPDVPVPEVPLEPGEDPPPGSVELAKLPVGRPPPAIRFRKDACRASTVAMVAPPWMRAGLVSMLIAPS